MKLTRGEITKLLDWVYNLELTWVVLMLTCFIGLIELLPAIGRNGSSISEITLTFFVTVIALGLIAGCVMCIDKLTRLSSKRVKLERQLPEAMRLSLKKTWGGFYRCFFDVDESGNAIDCKKSVKNLAICVFVIVWIAIIILKLI